MMSRRRHAVLAPLLAAVVLLLPGCLFESPLSEFSSANINTRLLGVFQYEEPADDPEKPPIIHRVAVVPSSEDRYLIFYRNVSKQPDKIWQFVGYQARVDNQFYLNVQDNTPGSPTFGKYVFFAFDWRYPSAVTLRQLNLEGFENATPFQLRAALRARRKDGELLPDTGVQWHMIARTYWDRSSGADPYANLPPEWEKGPLVSNPGF